MYKIAVLGDRDSVMGFKALGLDVFPAETPEVKGGQSTSSLISHSDILLMVEPVSD